MKLLRSVVPLMVAASCAIADPIISNLSDPIGPATSFGSAASTTFKAGGFEIVDTTDYQFNSITIGILSSDPNAVADVQLWRGTPTAPVTLVAELDGPLLNGAGEYTFTTDDSIVLQAGSVYWVYIANSQPGNFVWSGRTVNPTGVGATATGYVFNGIPSGTLNAFEVDASPIIGPRSIGNLAAPQDFGTAFGPAPVTTTFKAAGFRPNFPQRFNGVTISVDSADPGATADVQLWNGTASGPTSLLTTLSGPSLDGPGEYIFYASDSVVLQPGLFYWVYVANTSPARWLWEGRSAVPMGPGATHVGYVFNGSPSATENAYRINATSVAGDRIISNLFASTSAGTIFGSAAATVTKTGGFTMENRSFALEEVAIAIESSAPNARSSVQIWSGANGPTNFVTELDGPVFNGENDYTFRDRDNNVLLAGERYWVVIENTFPDEFIWEGRTQVPAGPNALNAGYFFNGNSSSFFNGFEVRGTVLPCSIIDISSPAQPGVPDGLLSGADFFFFLSRFEAGDLNVDFSSPASPGVPDGLLSGADFFFFLSRFEAGDLNVDFSSPASPGVPDGLLSGADFFFFLNLFSLGC